MNEEDLFSNIDADGVVEDHAKEVVNLQESEALKIVKAYSEVRKELQDRLLHSRYDSFTAQRYRSVLAQIDAAIDAANKQLHAGINAGAQKATVMSLEQLVRELNRFDKRFTGALRPINLNIIKTAIETKEFLMNQYERSLAQYGAQVKSQIARSLSQAVIQELPYSEVVHNVAQYFNGQEWQIHRLARTELHHIYSSSKLTGMKELKKEIVPDLKKGLYHPMDSRTGEDSIELAEMNPIMPLNEPFRQNYTPILANGKRGKTQKYVFMVPPNRPNDRAILIPVRGEWINV